MLLRLAVLLAACVLQAAAHAQGADRVSLSESTITWHTVKYATDADNGFVDGSLDETVIVDRTFKTYVLENRYLKVTLLPEFGGRILSIIYKPTGHEELYRTQVGVPYGMKAGNFYYDWMMVLWRHLPDIPDPRARQDVAEAVGLPGRQAERSSKSLWRCRSRTMSTLPRAPGRFKKGATGLEATY